MRRASASTARRAPTSRLPQLEEAIDAVIAELAEKGVTPEELERAKNRLIADAVYAQDNQATLARWYGVALTTGIDRRKTCSSWPDRIRAVTADEVRAGRAHVARQAPLRHRLSGQGHRQETAKARQNAREPFSPKSLARTRPARCCLR